MKIKTTYITDDGAEFDSEAKARIHEKTAAHRAEVDYDRFWETYGGKRLRDKHALDEYGMWRVRGEDGNCDLGGPRRIPDLGTVEGRLDDVVKWAVQQPGFWAWGAGGDIIKVVVKKV